MKPTLPSRILGWILLVVAAGLLSFGLADGTFFELTKNIEIFINAYKKIHQHYVEDKDPGELMNSAMKGLTKELDPFTQYIPESQIESYRLNIDGKYKGVGITVKKIDDYITITSVYESSPAEEAGLKVGDRILEVENKDVRGLEVKEVVHLLRGARGTPVRLRVQNLADKQPRTVTVVRDEVRLSNVPYYGMLDDSVGYIVLTTFTHGAGKNVQKAARQLLREGAKGIILDLRHNGGGLLLEAVNVVNTFIDKGELVVYTKGKLPNSYREYKTRKAPVDTAVPLVVLVDRATASASEIVSGVVQDLDRGIVIGTRTYGKGLVQNTFDVGYNSKIKITTAKYYIPSGRCIQSAWYEHGNRRENPDSLKQVYKTRSGRKVLGGGGIYPDIALRKPKYSAVLQDLLDRHWIFRFVTEEWEAVHPLCDSLSCDTALYGHFIQYLRQHHYQFEGRSMRFLDSAQVHLKREGWLNGMEDPLKRWRAMVVDAQWSQLDRARDTLVFLIGREIVRRRWHQTGEKRYNLQFDPWIDTAIHLVRNKALLRRQLASDILPGAKR